MSHVTRVSSHVLQLNLPTDPRNGFSPPPRSRCRQPRGEISQRSASTVNSLEVGHISSTIPTQLLTSKILHEFEVLLQPNKLHQPSQHRNPISGAHARVFSPKGNCLTWASPGDPSALMVSGLDVCKARRTQSVTSQKLTLNDMQIGLPLTLNGILLGQRN